MFMIIIWIASLWILMLFCVPIVFSIWKTCIRTLMTIRMVSVTPISISVPSFFSSHFGGMPVCTIISESTCPKFVEPTDFLSFYPYVFAAMVHCVTGSDSTLLKIQQIIIQLGVDPRPNTIGLVFIHPTSVKGFPSGYFLAVLWANKIVRGPQSYPFCCCVQRDST